MVRADTVGADTVGTNTGPVPASQPEALAPAAQPGAQWPGRTALAAELAKQRHVTLELQRAILPLHDEPFDLPGLRAMVRYLPASSASRVGGDWYITAELPSGHVLLAIGDVAGHAITGAPPQQLVGWLNDLVWHVAPEHTASVVAGYFEPVSGMLTWAQAGHPAPVLVRGWSARTLPQPDGILLGAGRLPYAAATVQLEPGDLLLLYSDGLVERHDRSIDEGMAILLSAARGNSDPDSVISAVLRALGSTDPEDDTCLVALQVIGGSG